MNPTKKPTGIASNITVIPSLCPIAPITHCMENISPTISDGVKYRYNISCK